MSPDTPAFHLVDQDAEDAQEPIESSVTAPSTRRRARDLPAEEARAALAAAAEVLEAGDRAVVAVDQDGRLVSINGPADELTGWGRLPLRGHRLRQVVVRDSVADVEDALAQLRSGLSWTGVVRVARSHGELVDVEVSADPVYDDGVVVGATAVLRWLSGRARELRVRELATGVMHAPDPMVAIDLQARVTEWNLSAQALFGWSRAEVLDAELATIVPPELLEQFLQAWTHVKAGRDVPAYETVRLHRDGRRQRVRVHVSGVREQGVVTGAVATFRALAERSSLAGATEHDEVTGLLGPVGVQRRLAVAPAAGTERAVAALNVDAFTLVTETLGHDSGDELMRTLADRLMPLAARSTACARRSCRPSAPRYRSRARRCT